MIHVMPPERFELHIGKAPSVFLAGSIEMGMAERWQEKIVEALDGHAVLVLNPRRTDWDSSWAQRIDNPHFRGQVEWELDALDAADTIVFYFDPATKAPITLMELGIHAVKDAKKCIVCCPEGFWRKGNVDIVCARYGIRQVETIDALISALKEG